MNERPFIVQRHPFFTVPQLERVEEAMLRILEQAGIAILDDEILDKLRACGFQSRDNRRTKIKSTSPPRKTPKPPVSAYVKSAHRRTKTVRNRRTHNRNP